MRLAGAGRTVTVLEREDVPGGRAGLVVKDTADGQYRFDTGPDGADDAGPHRRLLRRAGRGHGRLAGPAAGGPAVPRELRRRLQPLRLRRRGTHRAGDREALRRSGGRRVPALRRPRREPLPLRDPRLHRLQHRHPAGPAQAEPGPPRWRPAGSGRWPRRSGSSSRTPAPSGCSPSRPSTRGSRPTTRWPCTPSSPTWTPWPGCSSPRAGCTRCPRRWPPRRRSTACSSTTAPTVTAVERSGGRATAVITADGRRFPADVVVLNPDLPVARQELLGAPVRRKLTYSPSCYLLLAGSSQGLPGPGRTTRSTSGTTGRRSSRSCSTAA